jgi:iron complex outermembrane recepter protein
MLMFKVPFALLVFCLAGGVAHAQIGDDEDGNASRATDIIVTAPQLRGSVDVDIPPDLVLDGGAIDSYGASSAADLLSALSAQTRSGRGRGGGQPIVLVNGKRVSGFAEIRDLPSEAIQRVEVLPEDVALRFGFTADQRVINFILKDSFSAVTGEVEYGGPAAGGRGEAELQATWLGITKSGRINLSAQYDRDTALLESERDIQATGVDQTRFRTLLPTNKALALNAVVNRSLGGDVSATLNLRHNRADTRALFGIAGFLASGPVDPLTRDTRTRSFDAGLTLDGKFGRWAWTATANRDQARVLTLTDRGTLAPSLRDEARSDFTTTNGSYSVTGALAKLPAGVVMVNLRAGFDDRRITSGVSRVSGFLQSRLVRSETNARASIDIPLADRRRAVGSPLGDLSINLNGGYRRLSDFSAITAYGYGLNWAPVKGLSLLASVAVEDAAPTPQQLGDPRITTPNAILFDFARGQTVLVTQVTGGNSQLRAEQRRDVKVGLSYTPTSVEGLSLTANYFRNRSVNPIATFPALTEDSERAFPERIVRGPDGALLSIDQRPVNYLSAQTDQLRWGVSLAREFGQPPSQSDGMRSARASMGSGGGGGRGGGFGRFGGAGGRWSVSVFHAIKLRDKIQIAAAFPQLDLLNGDATGQNGGSPRHVVDLEAGWFNRGIGGRVIGAYQSATNLRGSRFSNDLRFSDLVTVNLRLFVNFEQRKKLTARMPFLRGSRIAFRVNNLFNDIQNVRDSLGGVPLRFQPGFVDPLGRTVEISFRKIF